MHSINRARSLLGFLMNLYCDTSNIINSEHNTIANKEKMERSILDVNSFRNILIAFELLFVIGVINLIQFPIHFFIYKFSHYLTLRVHSFLCLCRMHFAQVQPNSQK